MRFLCDRNQNIKLLDPPFNDLSKRTRAIKDYPPGIRENGSQYNHAVFWAAEAFATLGNTDMVLLSSSAPTRYAAPLRKMPRDATKWNPMWLPPTFIPPNTAARADGRVYCLRRHFVSHDYRKPSSASASAETPFHSPRFQNTDARHNHASARTVGTFVCTATENHTNTLRGIKLDGSPLDAPQSPYTLPRDGHITDLKYRLNKISTTPYETKKAPILPRKLERNSVWIVIPAYNEDSAIQSVIECSEPPDTKTFSLNDGSRDNTAAKAKGAGADVLTHLINRGQAPHSKPASIYQEKHTIRGVSLPLMPTDNTKHKT